MSASAISVCVSPLFMPMFTWPVSWATWPDATSALTVTRLRSRGARSGPQPKIAEENVGRVLHDAGKYRAEQVADALGAVRFGGFVERQQVWRRAAATDRP